MKYLLSLHYLVWLFLSAIFFAFGEFLSKKFALHPSANYVLIILAIYSLGTLAWLPAILQKNQLSLVGVIWSVLSLLATVMIGALIFSEKISLLGAVGIVTAIVSIILLSLG